MNKTEYNLLFTAALTPEVVHLKPSKYILIDKQVLAESSEALLALKPLYMLCEKALTSLEEQETNSTINPLEGIWSFIDKNIGVRQPSNIIGNLMIKQSDNLSDEEFEGYKNELTAKHQNEDFIEYLQEAKLVTVDEGVNIKMLHIGPYSKEQSTFDTMEVFAKNKGLKRKYDNHRETYLKDLRTVKADKFETILKFQVM